MVSVGVAKVVSTVVVSQDVTGGVLIFVDVTAIFVVLVVVVILVVSTVVNLVEVLGAKVVGEVTTEVVVVVFVLVGVMEVKAVAIFVETIVETGFVDATVLVDVDVLGIGVTVFVTVFVTTCAIAPPHTRARAKTPRKAKDNFILIFFLLV